MLAPWVVALLRAVLPLDGEPVVARIDAGNPRILAFRYAGLLRAAAVAQMRPLYKSQLLGSRAPAYAHVERKRAPKEIP